MKWTQPARGKDSNAAPIEQEIVVEKLAENITAAGEAKKENRSNQKCKTDKNEDTVAVALTIDDIDEITGFASFEFGDRVICADHYSNEEVVLSADSGDLTPFGSSAICPRAADKAKTEVLERIEVVDVGSGADEKDGEELSCRQADAKRGTDAENAKASPALARVSCDAAAKTLGAVLNAANKSTGSIAMSEDSSGRNAAKMVRAAASKGQDVASRDVAKASEEELSAEQDSVEQNSAKIPTGAAPLVEKVASVSESDKKYDGTARDADEDKSGIAADDAANADNNNAETPCGESAALREMSAADAATIPADAMSTGSAGQHDIMAKSIKSEHLKPARPFAAALTAFGICAVLLIAPMVVLHYAGTLVYIYEDGALAGVALCKANSPELAFEQAGVPLGEADEVSTQLFGASELMTVTRAHEIGVTADGKTQKHRVLDKTVAQALGELGIKLGDLDRVEPALEHLLVQGDAISVHRVREEYRDVTETVPWDDVTKYSPLIDDGEKLVMDEGEERDGIAFRSYRDTYVDGKLEKSEIVSEIIDQFPWNLVTLEGKADAEMSPIDAAKFTDIKIIGNKPEKYERVIENGVCTAYSFNPGTWGASGMYMFQGFVAVDTSVIPYGSLLYITSPTGKFTYGWAIAADVGEAMVAGYVDIDLFFETYRESALFGKHKMNVYVVKQLTQSELEPYMANEGMFRRRVPQ
ncbi:MAG: 3D domain-containing protein [Oscillospiraceae bacterium]